MKTKLLILIFSFLILTACGTSKPIATVHHERIETQMQAVPIGADTIEITLHSRDAACCVRSPQRSKNNPTSVEIQRALLTKSNSESLNPNQRSLNRRRKNGKKSFKSVNQRSLSLWREKSVGDKTSQSDKNSVRDKTLETAIQRIEQHHIDVTTHYHDWYRIGMALASHYGEAGRDYYHRISRFYPHYTPQETNKQYDLCLRYNTHRIHLGTLFYLIQNTDDRVKIVNYAFLIPHSSFLIPNSS